MPKALIVEDEPLMREYLWRNLDRIHNAWKATACAKDGLEAIEILRHHSFDLVITDIRMPHCDGLELASYINDNCPGTAVVILSGHDEFEYARSALQKGVSDYLLKPLDDKALNALLDRLASNKKLSVDDGDEEPAVQDQDSESPSLLIERARLFIKENYTRPLALNDVAQALDVSPSYLSSVFKSDKGEGAGGEAACELQGRQGRRHSAGSRLHIDQVLRLGIQEVFRHDSERIPPIGIRKLNAIGRKELRSWR